MTQSRPTAQRAPSPQPGRRRGFALRLRGAAERTRGVVRDLLPRVDLAVLLVPIAIAVFVGWAASTGLYRGERVVLERLAVRVLIFVGFVSAARAAHTRHPFDVWGTALVVVLLCREFHFAGTSEGVYVALIGLGAVAVHRYEVLAPYLRDRILLDLLAIGIASYGIAVSVDQRAWRGFPGEERFHVPLEETMEVVGHVAIGLAILLSRGWRQRLPSA